MDHQKNSSAQVSTETKLSPAHPKSKKPKLNDSPSPTHTHASKQHTQGHAESDMAAPTAKRPLFSEVSTDAPPQWFRSFEVRLDSKIDSLFEKLTLKIKEQEEKIQSLDSEVEKIQKEVDVVKKENEWLINKLDDLENRNRRKNLVIFGIPESKGGKEDCHKVVGEFFTFAGVQSTDLGAIERCHRTPGSLRNNKPNNAKPRMIHIGFATYVVKERVRKACISKLKECKVYMDSKLFIAEDLSKRVLELRKRKVPQLQRLREEGRRPFFIYPDRLCYRDNTTGKLVNVEPS